LIDLMKLHTEAEKAKGQAVFVPENIDLQELWKNDSYILHLICGITKAINEELIAMKLGGQTT